MSRRLCVVFILCTLAINALAVQDDPENIVDRTLGSIRRLLGAKPGNNQPGKQDCSGNKCKNSGGVCFPPSSFAQTPIGPKRLDALQTGDLVLTVGKSGAVEFKPIYFIAHKDVEKLGVYVQVEMVSTSSELTTLQLTHPHFMAASADPTGECIAAAQSKTALKWTNNTSLMPAWESHEIVQAQFVRAGMIAWNIKNGVLSPTCVLKTSEVITKGGITPFVKAEGIVIDGAVASPHLMWPKLILPISRLPQHMLPSVYDFLLTPIYAMFSILGGKGMWAINNTAFFGNLDLFFPVVGNALVLFFVTVGACGASFLFNATKASKVKTI